MALFGWTTAKRAAIYTRKASRTKLDSEAARLLEGQTSNESVPLFPTMASGGTMRPKSR
jgi:hypothetical protein